MRCDWTAYCGERSAGSRSASGPPLAALRRKRRTDLIRGKRLALDENLAPLGALALLGPIERDEQVVEVARQRARAGNLGLLRPDDGGQAGGDGLVDVLPRPAMRVIKVSDNGAASEQNIQRSAARG